MCVLPQDVIQMASGIPLRRILDTRYVSIRCEKMLLQVTVSVDEGPRISREAIILALAVGKGYNMVAQGVQARAEMYDSGMICFKSCVMFCTTLFVFCY